MTAVSCRATREKQLSSESHLLERTTTKPSSASSGCSSSNSTVSVGSPPPPPPPSTTRSLLAITTPSSIPHLSLAKNATKTTTASLLLLLSSSSMHHSMRGQARKLLPAAAAKPPPEPPTAAISASASATLTATPPPPSQSEKCLIGLTELFLADLAKDSVFMQENDQRDMPTFKPEDVTIGPELGHGEFGVVLEVRGLTSDEKCNCFKCIAAAARNANDGRGGGSSSGSLSSKDDDACFLGSEEIDAQFVAAHTGTCSSQQQQQESRSALPKSIIVKRCPDTPPSSHKKHHRNVGSLGTVTFAEEHLVLMPSPKMAARKKSNSFDNLVQLEDSKKSNINPPPPPLPPPLSTSPKLSGKKKMSSLENLAQLNTEDDGQSVYSTEEAVEDDVKAAFVEQSIDDEPSEVGLSKARMSAHVIRQGAARYAVKHLRQTLGRDARADAVIDLACEAAYLSRIVHSNVVRLRATVGKPGTASFMLIMDRLGVTLKDKIFEWKALRKQHRGSFLDGILGKRNKEGIHALFVVRLMAVFDIARALRYLHRKCIMYRDIKPENVGVDVRGDMRIFDFGLAKELKPKDLVKSPEDYNATGLTGSRRYMAPEVVRCVNYGYTADVYSFSILFWQLFSLETPFKRLDSGKHFDRVVMSGKRPYKLNHDHLPSKMLHQMMEDAWSEDRTKRPTFHQICQFLQAELMDATTTMNTTGSNNSAIGDRSVYLMNRSNTSLFNNSERAAAAAAYKEVHC